MALSFSLLWPRLEKVLGRRTHNELRKAEQASQTCDSCGAVMTSGFLPKDGLQCNSSQCSFLKLQELVYPRHRY